MCQLTLLLLSLFTHSLVAYAASVTFSANNTSSSSILVVSDSGCAPNKTAGRVKGTDLWCYECKEIYTKKYDPLNSPCRHNLSTLQPRRCGPKDRFCKVERLGLHRTMLSLERTCVQECPYGCKFNGYGLTYKRCISCCDTYACNDGNAASGLHGWRQRRKWTFTASLATALCSLLLKLGVTEILV